MLFLRAAAGLGLEPRQTVVIEGAPQGVEAALAGGFPVVALITSRPAADLEGVHLIAREKGALAIAGLAHGLLNGEGGEGRPRRAARRWLTPVLSGY